MSNRIAAIDMGTNSFHLLIGYLKENGSLKVLDTEKEVIRLGSHKGEDLSVISEGEIEKAIDILRQFKNLAKYHHAEIMAVATSAVREATNKDEFLTKVLEATKIKVEVIDGIKEAGLIFKGVKKGLPIESDNVLCIDIGGGSTEVVYAEKGKKIFSESLKIGAVRLNKMFFHKYYLDDEKVKDCIDYIDKMVNTLPVFHPDYGVGTSGTINATAKMIFFQEFGEPIKSLNEYSFNTEDFVDIHEQVLSAKRTVDRLAINGMEMKRADIIPAGLMILKKIILKYNLRKIKISEYALRTGIIVDSLEREESLKILNPRNGD